MPRSDNLYQLPENLPTPIDDGACDHLWGMEIPSLSLLATSDQYVDISRLNGRSVIYCYPRTGEPDKDPPPGWNEIPGARGCTPQSCAFRDHFQELKALGAQVFGLSTQDSNYQLEAVKRLHLPFPLLSDEFLTFTNALKLPTFSVAGMTLIKRLTLIVKNGRIEHLFYPVFPPNQNAAQVIAWLKNHPEL